MTTYNEDSPHNSRQYLADVDKATGAENFDAIPLDPEGLPIFAPGATWPVYSWEFDDESEPRDGDAGDEIEAAFWAERGIE